MRNTLKPVLIFVGGFFYLLLAGCSSVPLQSSSLLENTPQNLQRSVELKQTPFNPQLEYQCGPAALATLLQFQQLDVTPDALVQEVYLPDRKGSLQIELVAAARRHNMLPYVIDKKLLDLLNEIQAGNPVLVLQNLGLDAFPQWHYAVVVGYDLDKDEIYLRSGEFKRHVNSFSRFERTWQRSKYWGMVVLPLDRLPRTATPFRYLSSAVAFEKLGKPEQARTAYYTALKQWPDNRHLMMAAGNISYQLSQLDEAEKQYRDVVAQSPGYAPALNNLAEIKFDQKKFSEAESLARKAVEIGGQFSSQYQQTLDKILSVNRHLDNQSH